MKPSARRRLACASAVAAVALGGCATADTNPATQVTDDAANLNATVTPRTYTATYWFEYGTTTAYGLRTPGRQLGAAAGTRAVTEPVSGLLANTRYHYRSCSSDADASGCGADLTFTTAATAAHLQPGFRQSTVVSGLDSPVALRFSPDGRIFIAEKSGLIKILDSLTDTTTTVFADLRLQVHNFWDRGLLGLALDPQFPTRPYIYVLYTRDAAIGATPPRWGRAGASSDGCPDPPGATRDGCVVSGRLSRLTASGDAMVGSEQVLVDGWCQQFPSHSVGSLGFAANGALYASAGDGASFNAVDYGQFGGNPCGDPGGTAPTPPDAEGGALRSQDVRTSADPTGLNGSVIRIDPSSGQGWPGNPFAASASADERRIVAYGLRNPFRFIVRPGTSDLWLADVGWNDYEEIDRVADPGPPAENFGWPCYEGLSRQPGYDAANLTICESLYTTAGAVTPPRLAYAHSAAVVAGDGCPVGSSSVSGVSFAFYGGGPYPAEYDGALFFADYARNCIWAVQVGADGLPAAQRLKTFVRGAAAPVDLQTGPNGDLFYVDFTGGTVRRVSYSAGNSAPNAVATATPSSGPAPLQVGFSAAGSSDPDAGDTLAYAWDLDDDGALDDATSVAPSWSYAANGSHRVTLRVTDSQGSSDVQTLTVGVGPPVITMASPAAGTTWQVGDAISLQGSAVDATGQPLPASALSWSIVINHCPSSCHQHLVQRFDGVAATPFPAPDHEYPAYLTIQLRATDATGLSATASRDLQPQTVRVTLDGIPSGVVVATLNGEQAQTPFTRVVIRGSANTIGVDSPNASGLCCFASWSDGGAQTHVVAPRADTTYVARFGTP